MFNRDLFFYVSINQRVMFFFRPSRVKRNKPGKTDWNVFSSALLLTKSQNLVSGASNVPFILTVSDFHTKL